MRRLLDRRITILKRDAGEDELGRLLDGFADGRSLRASHEPVSDGEKLNNGQVEHVHLARFVVRHSSYSAAITGDDRLWFEGAEWQVSGLKTLGRKRWVEITAWRK